MNKTTREIKFRFWDNVVNKMNYHDESCDKSLMMCFSGSIFSNEGEDAWTCRDYRFFLMQYTGLKDDNGKEIYDGDIIEYTFCSHGYCGKRQTEVVIFKGGIFGIESDIGTDRGTIPDNYMVPLSDHQFFGGHLREIKIIGNIYENPELK